MAQYVVHDSDQAATLASMLTKSGETIGSVVEVMKNQAEQVLALDKTVHLNEQLSDYLKEAAECLKGVIPGIEEAGQQLSNIVAQAAEFENLANSNTLGSV